MKKLFLVIAALAIATFANAQAPQYGRFHKSLFGSAAPTATCTDGTLYYSSSTNKLYSCESNTWVSSASGAVGNDFFNVTGPASTIKTFTFPNANATVLTTNAAVTVAQGGTGAATLTGLLQGNGTSAFTAITNSSTVGQTLRVTGAATYAWGALDLADSDAVTGILGSANGGTGNGFTKFSGPTTAEKTFTLPDANATLLYEGGAIGAVTPAAGTFTDLKASTSLSPTTAGGIAAGTTALPFSSVYIGDAATNNFQVTGTATGAQVVTIPDATFTVGQVEVTFHDEVTGNATDRAFFLATRGYIVTACSQIHSVAAGGASHIQVTLETTTGAPGTGTDLLTNNANAGFDLNATANTTQVGTLVAVGSRTLVAGDRLSVDYADAIQATAGNVITCSLMPN